MTLTKYVNSRFAAQDRDRGLHYFRDGAVTHLSSSGQSARFRVQGENLYQVDITFDGKVASLNCTCPHFR